MGRIGREIYRSIQQRKWLGIGYMNKNGEHTSYWLDIMDIDPIQKKITGDAFNSTKKLDTLQVTVYIDKITDASVIEGTYGCDKQPLIDKMNNHPSQFDFLYTFKNHDSILDYLVEANRLDTTPHKNDFTFVDKIDEDELKARGKYVLNEKQFMQIINALEKKMVKHERAYSAKKKFGFNIISIAEQAGLYVLAYKEIYLDVKEKTLVLSKDVITNKKFSVDGETKSIAFYLSEDDLGLLERFDENKQFILEALHESQNSFSGGIDTNPYVFEIQYDHFIDLRYQYSGIEDMLANNTLSEPLKGFFGEIKQKPRRIKNYSITLMDDKINLDQLRAIHNALKYPLTYVQGPPGTGKTVTILNTVISAFFNEKTVLVSSYNNHPVDGVYEKLRNLKYKTYPILFPALRLGNQICVMAMLDEIKMMYETAMKLDVYDDYLIKNKKFKENQLEKLSKLLADYEERTDLLERKRTLHELLGNLPYKLSVDVQSKQLEAIEKRLNEIGDIHDADAMELLATDYEEFMMYLNFTSIKFIQRLSEPKYKPLLEIIYDEDEQNKAKRFNKYIADDANFKQLLRVFPVVITTNISAMHLGSPKPYFDLAIMDESSQCDLSTALLPIIRGDNLMLVGDPQQLRPVITLDPTINEKLMKKYEIDQEYDYITQSIYTTYVSVDAVSSAILLSYHYRCNDKIIAFNNLKYYNSQLKIKSNRHDQHPLMFIDTNGDNQISKNISTEEAEAIVSYVKSHPDEDVGVITPFVKQKATINEFFEENGIEDVTCGTIHAFQGDEKDVILFSTAITKRTREKTYDWLKNNKELINVATTRARKRLVMYGSKKHIRRLNKKDPNNDFNELYRYILKNGKSRVTPKTTSSRALGVKPFSTATEKAFMKSLNHALNITMDRHIVRKEVPISSIFGENIAKKQLFYSGRFDFVIFRVLKNKEEEPVFAIELDGPEHNLDEEVKTRDKEKEAIAKKHHLRLIRVPNVYARRYDYIKQILMDAFVVRR